MWKCEKCKEYRVYPAMKCFCKDFEIIDEEGDCFTVRSMDEEGAALSFAKESNESNENYLLDSELEISVGEKHFRISAEIDISYSATEITNES